MWLGHGHIRINKEDQSFGYNNSNNILKLKSLYHYLSTVIPLFALCPTKKKKKFENWSFKELDLPKNSPLDLQTLGKPQIL